MEQSSLPKKSYIKTISLQLLTGLVAAGIFSVAFSVVATAWPYTPPAPLEPGCSSSDPTCTVSTLWTRASGIISPSTSTDTFSLDRGAIHTDGNGNLTASSFTGDGSLLTSGNSVLWNSTSYPSGGSIGDCAIRADDGSMSWGPCGGVDWTNTTANLLTTGSGTFGDVNDTLQLAIKGNSPVTSRGFSFVGTASTGSGSYPVSVTISGNYAYVVNNVSDKLQKFDISGDTPVLKGELTTGSSPRSVAVSGNYAYVVNLNGQTLQKFDISGDNPVLKGTVSTGQTSIGLAVYGNYAYVVNYNSDNLQKFDISADAPVLKGEASTDSHPYSVAVSGKYAYVVNYNSGTFQKFDISGDTPVSIADIPTYNAGPSSVAISGNYAYVVNTNNNKLQKFDISGYTPISAGSDVVTGPSPVFVAASGSYAYVLNNGDGSLQKFDMSENIPVQVGDVILTDVSPDTIAVSGNYIYVVNHGSDTLQKFKWNDGSGTQTAHLQDWQDYSGVTLAYVNSLGNITAPNLSAGTVVGSTITDGTCTISGGVLTGCTIAGLTSSIGSGIVNGVLDFGANNIAIINDGSPYGINIGHLSASGIAASAFGESATAYGTYSTAVGMNAYTTAGSGDYSIALGFYAVTSGDSSVALGRQASTNTDGQYAAAIGYAANASGQGAYALGRQADASGSYSYAIGYGASATASNSFAIGTNVVNSTSDSVAVKRLIIKSPTQSDFYLSSSANDPGFVIGRSYMSDNNNDFFIYDQNTAKLPFRISSTDHVSFDTDQITTNGSGTLTAVAFKQGIYNVCDSSGNCGGGIPGGANNSLQYKVDGTTFGGDAQIITDGTGSLSWGGNTGDFKLKLYDGGDGNIYGLGVRSNQFLQYIPTSSTANKFLWGNMGSSSAFAPTMSLNYYGSLLVGDHTTTDNATDTFNTPIPSTGLPIPNSHLDIRATGSFTNGLDGQFAITIPSNTNKTVKMGYDPVGYGADYITLDNPTGSNDNGFAWIQSVRNYTGSTPLVLQPYDSTGKETGPVLIGTKTAMPSSPFYRLQVNGLVNFNNNGIYSDTNNYLYAAQFNQTSDARLKTNVIPLGQSGSVMDRLENINGIYYNWNETYNKMSPSANLNRRVGILAQNMQTEFPELVTQMPNGYYSLDYSSFSAVLLEGLKELNTKVNLLTVTGAVGNGQVSGINSSVVTDLVKTGLGQLGFTFQSGANAIANITADALTVKTAKVNGLEMVDKTTGEIYCTYIENGELQKAKGDCATAGVSQVVASIPTASVVQPLISQQAQQAVNVAQQAAQAAAQTVQQQAQLNQQQTQQIQILQQQIDQQSQTTNISSVSAVPTISVDYGTQLSAVGLPSTVGVTLSDSTTQQVSVVWNQGSPAYNPEASGTYAFAGTLTFSGSITNTDNLTASVSVTVNPNPQPAEVKADDSAATTEIIQNAASDLLNGAWNFIKNILGTVSTAALSSPFAQNVSDNLSGIPSKLKSLQLNADVKSLGAGLITPIGRLEKAFKK